MAVKGYNINFGQNYTQVVTTTNAPQTYGVQLSVDEVAIPSREALFELIEALKIYALQATWPLA